MPGHTVPLARPASPGWSPAPARGGRGATALQRPGKPVPHSHGSARAGKPTTLGHGGMQTGKPTPPPYDDTRQLSHLSESSGNHSLSPQALALYPERSMTTLKSDPSLELLSQVREAWPVVSVGAPLNLSLFMRSYPIPLCRPAHKWMMPWGPAPWSSNSSLRPWCPPQQPWGEPCTRRPGVHWPWPSPSAQPRWTPRFAS